MPGTIDLHPSSDPNALIDAIISASAGDKKLKLHSGTHYTTSGAGKEKRTKIGKNGLRIEGPNKIFPSGTNAIIKRPDESIDLDNPDDNYGLFFIPADATDDEFNDVSEWKRYQHGEQDFQYAVITRGVIDISNLVIDCNMAKQKLETLYTDDRPEGSEPAEHSCMFGFSGSVTVAKNGPLKGNKLFVAFEKVVFKNVHIINGGYADDIWIPPGVSGGYFNPNIDEMRFSTITTGPRIAAHRATISFSGLVGKLFINNADIYNLHCEQTGPKWDELPRKNDEYKDSYWDLKKMRADFIGIGIRGKNVYLNASNLLTREAFALDRVGGLIQNSIFNKGSDPRLFRLNNAVFRNVNWVFAPNKDGIIQGIKLAAKNGEECTAIFSKNNFKVNSLVKKEGRLIDSEYSGTVPGNAVGLTFANCTYDPRFGLESYPDTCIFRAFERGIWTIKKSDFGTRDEDKCVKRIPAHTDVDINLV